MGIFSKLFNKDSKSETSKASTDTAAVSDELKAEVEAQDTIDVPDVVEVEKDGE